MDSLVTIVLPAYNAEKYVEGAIISILEQTDTRFELWIVDDKSTDSTFSLIEKFKVDKRVRIFRNEVNMGLASLLNHYHKMVKTPFIARMDSDDIMFRDRLKRQISVLTLFPHIDVLGTQVLSFQSRIPKVVQKTEDAILFRKKTLPHPTILGRTQWFKDNPYNESLRRNEDAELWMRCSDSNLYLLNEPLLFYREDPNVYVEKYSKGFRDSVKILLLHRSLSAFLFVFRYASATFLYWSFGRFSAVGLLLKRRRR